MKTEIKTLVGKMKADYIKFATANGTKKLESAKGHPGFFATEVANFENDITITSGRKYIKIVYRDCVWGFIVKENFKHFIKGDILKAAGFNAPTLNRARGNIFALDNLSVKWTGANYLK